MLTIGIRIERGHATKSPRAGPEGQGFFNIQIAVVGRSCGVGTWGRTFQVWVGWFSWGTCSGADGVSTAQTSLFSVRSDDPPYAWVKTVGAGAEMSASF